jgi:magnesium transporter
MARLNPLVTDFLDKHPADCARILEQLSVHTACSLIRYVQPGRAAGILECMVTAYGSECLHALDARKAVSIIKEMKTPQAARLLRAMSLEHSRHILDMLPVHIKSNIHSSLRYPDQTVGRIMDSKLFSLPESISVSDAIKRLTHLRQRTVHEIFAVDDDHKLKGVIHVADLLSAARSSSLQTIIMSDVPSLSTRTSLHSAAMHVGWQTFSTLPVVGKDNILSGTLKSSTLMHVLAVGRSSSDSPDALHDFFSIAKMYWLVMAELISTFAGNTKEIGTRRN